METASGMETKSWDGNLELENLGMENLGMEETRAGKTWGREKTIVSHIVHSTGLLATARSVMVHWWKRSIEWYYGKLWLGK